MGQCVMFDLSFLGNNSCEMNGSNFYFYSICDEHSAFNVIFDEMSIFCL